MRCTTTVDSPIGRMMLVGSDEALEGLFMEPHHEVADSREDPAAFRRVTAQLEAWFAGERSDFDVPIAPRGTPFQLGVWQALREIPYGTTAGYGELAARLGNPKASRAVGLANGRNPISVIVPCHRVIGANGRLTGYAGGLERKRWLLSHEAAVSGHTLALRA